MYIILTGSIGVFFENDNETNLEDECVVTLGPNKQLGERAYLAYSSKHSKTARALVFTKCLKLGREVFTDKISYYEHLLKK